MRVCGECGGISVGMALPRDWNVLENLSQHLSSVQTQYNTCTQPDTIELTLNGR